MKLSEMKTQFQLLQVLGAHLRELFPQENSADRDATLAAPVAPCAVRRAGVAAGDRPRPLSSQARGAGDSAASIEMMQAPRGDSGGGGRGEVERLPAAFFQLLSEQRQKDYDEEWAALRRWSTPADRASFRASWGLRVRSLALSLRDRAAKAHQRQLQAHAVGQSLVETWEE
jgi:hypothetical protein